MFQKTKVNKKIRMLAKLYLFHFISVFVKCSGLGTIYITMKKKIDVQISRLMVLIFLDIYPVDVLK